jgi:hypothetical protein
LVMARRVFTRDWLRILAAKSGAACGRANRPDGQPRKTRMGDGIGGWTACVLAGLGAPNPARESVLLCPSSTASP